MGGKSTSDHTPPVPESQGTVQLQSQVHKAHGESLKGEGTSTGLLTVFNEGVVPHPHPTQPPTTPKTHSKTQKQTEG